MNVAAGQIALALFLLLFAISLVVAGLPKVVIAVVAFIAAILILVGK